MFTMNPDGPSKDNNNKNKTQTEKTEPTQDVDKTDHEFPEALYFDVDDETPAMPEVRVLGFSSKDIPPLFPPSSGYHPPLFPISSERPPLPSPICFNSFCNSALNSAWLAWKFRFFAP